MMEGEQYYIKIGKRYKPVKEFQGFPAEGIWLVHEGSQSRILKLSDVRKPDLSLLELSLAKTIILKTLGEVVGKTVSLKEVADKIVEDLNEYF